MHLKRFKVIRTKIIFNWTLIIIIKHELKEKIKFMTVIIFSVIIQFSFHIIQFKNVISTIYATSIIFFLF